MKKYHVERYTDNEIGKGTWEHVDSFPSRKEAVEKAVELCGTDFTDKETVSNFSTVYAGEKYQWKNITYYGEKNGEVWRARIIKEEA